MRFAILALVLVSCKVTQRQEISGEAKARVIVEFPQAQECFDDPRIENFEQLKECLSLITNNKWTVTIDGEVVPAVEKLVPEGEG